MPRIVYDMRNCEGFFVCVTSDPENFIEDELDGDEKATVPGANEVEDGLFIKSIDADEVEPAKEAAKGCPASVIQVIDDDGNVLAGPEALPVQT